MRTYLVVALALIAVSCAAPVPEPTATPTPPAPTSTLSDPLVTVTTRGGLCPAGACESTIFVERDGRVHVAAKPPNELGVVPPAQLAALDAAIRATDFTELRSQRFTGQCPTAFDGQEIVFDFGAPTAIERIASCEVEVDYGSPLFVAVTNALSPFMTFPVAR
jgi:hypothetical protein